MRTLRIPSSLFDELAAGRGELQGVLRDGQLSRRVLLLRQLRQTARSCVPDLCETAGTEEAFAVLADARRTDGPTVDAVLLHPHIGTWLDGALRSLLTSGDIKPEVLGHLGNLAAAAAVGAGQPFVVTAAVSEGAVPLPGLGSLHVPNASGWCQLSSEDGTEFEVITSATRTTVFPALSEQRGNWSPLRRLARTAGGIAVDIELNDLDPFRSCGLPVDGRLDDTTATKWQDHVDRAWPLLVEHHRPWAEAVAGGISTVVPLRSTRQHMELSGSCHGAVGAVSMTAPTSPLGLALALVHELQHNKLWALIDLVPLLRPSSERRLYSPWKADPRPWTGLLHGAYAFLGLTDVWNTQRHVSARTGDSTDVAHVEFALARSQVRHGIEVLLASGPLTEPGERFVAGMSHRLEELEDIVVDQRFLDLADLVLRDHATSWRLRNARPDSDQVGAWAEAWVAGLPRPPEPMTTEVVDGDAPISSLARRDLAREMLGRSPTTGDGLPSGAGDRLLLDGRDDEAAHAYLSQIANDPDDAASWAGLALAWRARRGAAGRSLIEASEVIAAVYRRILERSGQAPAVDDLAEWLAVG